MEKIPRHLDSSPHPDEPLQKEQLPVKSRILVMLGARMINPKGLENWQFPLFISHDTDSSTPPPGEISGGFSRMRGVQSEYEQFQKENPSQKMIVLVTGGKEKDGSSRADEAARQLISRYGLPENSVISLGSTGSTLGNAGATVEYIRAHQEELGAIDTIEIATNEYHMLRAWVMFTKSICELTTKTQPEIASEDIARIEEIFHKALRAQDTYSPSLVKETRIQVMTILEPYFKNSDIQVVPVVTEDSLEKDATFAREKYAQLLRQNPHVHEALEREFKGVLDFLKGTYQKKS